MLISAIVMAARDAAADIEQASAEPGITPERALALKSRADNLYAIAHQAEEHDPEAVRLLCDILGLDKLLAEYEAECRQEQDSSPRP